MPSDNDLAEALADAAVTWHEARLRACAAPMGDGAVWTNLGTAETALSAIVRKNADALRARPETRAGDGTGEYRQLEAVGKRPLRTDIDAEVVIYSKQFREYWREPLHGTTKKHREAHVYKLEDALRLIGAATELFEFREPFRSVLTAQPNTEGRDA